jgi:hypothetical protein
MLTLGVANAGFLRVVPSVRRPSETSRAVTFAGFDVAPPQQLPVSLHAVVVECHRSSRSATESVNMMAVASPPRPVKSKSSAVTRRGGGQLISWYFNSISSTRLLSHEQERQLSSMIIAGDKYEAVRAGLEEELGRQPSRDEWAAALSIDRSELRKRLRRASSARDLMVAANSA